MIKFTLEAVVVMAITILCLVIALGLMFGRLVPVLLIGGIVYYVYNHKKKPVEHKCPECEVREKVEDL